MGTETKYFEATETRGDDRGDHGRDPLMQFPRRDQIWSSAVHNFHAAKYQNNTQYGVD